MFMLFIICIVWFCMLDLAGIFAHSPSSETRRSLFCGKKMLTYNLLHSSFDHFQLPPEEDIGIPKILKNIGKQNNQLLKEYCGKYNRELVKATCGVCTLCLDLMFCKCFNQCFFPVGQLGEYLASSLGYGGSFRTAMLGHHLKTRTCHDICVFTQHSVNIMLKNL